MLAVNLVLKSRILEFQVLIFLPLIYVHFIQYCFFLSFLTSDFMHLDLHQFLHFILAWWGTVHKISKGQILLTKPTHILHFTFKLYVTPKGIYNLPHRVTGTY